MNQCVPSWDLDENSGLPGNDVRSAHSNSNSLPPDVPTLDYEVAELTWKNGQLAMHGLGPPRLGNKPILTSSPTKYSTWDKPRAGGTLESIVNQATRLPDPKTTLYGGGDELVPWFDHHRAMVHPTASTSIAVTMDALVPCNNNVIINRNENQVPSAREIESIPQSGTCVVGSSTRVGSCSGVAAATLDGGIRETRIARVEINSCDTNGSASESATCGRDSRQLTLYTRDKKLGATGFTSPSMESPENTSSAKDYSKSTGDDHDSVCHSRPQRGKCHEEEGKKRGAGKSSLSMKRSRAAAIHNQSERKRRDRINQRMKTLQKLVPNSSKTDKASMLDEVIEYLKQLQAQVQIMRMNMSSPMMLPLAMQQQLQMSMMHQASPMGMGMGMGMAGMGIPGIGMPGMGMPGMGIMDINNAMGRMTSGMPQTPAAAFMPAAAASWDNPGDRALSTPAASVMTDPLSAFLACQSQLMTFDAYNRLAAMYQQFQHPPGSNSKN